MRILHSSIGRLQCGCISVTAKESGPLIVTNNSNQHSVWYLHGDSELVQVCQFPSYLLHFFLPFMHIRTALEYRLLLPNYYTIFSCDLLYRCILWKPKCIIKMFLIFLLHMKFDRSKINWHYSLLRSSTGYFELCINFWCRIFLNLHFYMNQRL